MMKEKGKRKSEKVWTSLLFALSLFLFAFAAEAKWDDLYRPLEYIESTGSQWIDTGYIPNVNDTIEERIRFLDSGEFITSFGWCARGSSWDKGTFCFLVQNNKYRCDWGAVGDLLDSVLVDTNSTAVLRAEANKFYLDEKLIYTSKPKSFTTVGGPILLFSSYTLSGGVPDISGMYHQRLYYLRVTDSSGKVVHDYRPCLRDVDQVSGLYDTAAGGFFTSTGEVSFVAGPRLVPPSVEITEAWQSKPGSGVVDYTCTVRDLEMAKSYDLVIKVCAKGATPVEFTVENVTVGTVTRSVNTKELFGHAYPNVTLYATVREKE